MRKAMDGTGTLAMMMLTFIAGTIFGIWVVGNDLRCIEYSYESNQCVKYGRIESEAK
jgi:hypothetical protein